MPGTRGHTVSYLFVIGRESGTRTQIEALLSMPDDEPTRPIPEGCSTQHHLSILSSHWSVFLGAWFLQVLLLGKVFVWQTSPSSYIFLLWNIRNHWDIYWDSLHPCAQSYTFVNIVSTVLLVDQVRIELTTTSLQGRFATLSTCQPIWVAIYYTIKIVTQ